MASNVLSNGDEVRRKPTSRSTKTAPGTTHSTGYYDILVVGRTGKGKSSTVDKLMVPNSRQQTICPPSDSSQRSGASQSEAVDPIIDTTGEIQYKNLRARILSTKADDYENAGKRLKNIVFCREANNPIDRLRNDKDLAGVYCPSKLCELLTNEDSKIRALDAPGFFSEDLIEGCASVDESHLATVRHILRIQALEGMRFKRVLYFLSDTQERGDRVMQQEIQNMVKFFDTSIFKCMVLVATIAQHISVATDFPRERKFPQEVLKKCRENFQKAFRREFEHRRDGSEKLPEPPIIFIAMTDTCQDIVKNILSAPVQDNTYLLEFNSGTCSKCNIEFSEKLCEYRKRGEKPWTNASPYEETSCHPRIMPLHTPKSVLIGIFKIFIFKWKFTEEVCISCKKKPGYLGCCRVRTEYQQSHSTEKIVVKHSNRQ